MAFAALEILVDRVRSDLVGHFNGRPARRRAALEGLLKLLVTAETPPHLAGLTNGGEQIRGLRTHLSALERHLQYHSQLPEALCARYKYKHSQARTIERYSIGRRTWAYFHELARELEWEPDLHIPQISYEHFDWHDELEERFARVEVILDSLALEGMLLSALEGYLSPRKARRKGYEVYGVNLGMTRQVHHRSLRDGLRITRYISVMRAQPQLSADATYGFVEPNTASLRALLRTVRTLYPHYQAVGDFHSHPYDDLAALDAKRGWEYTASDEQSNIEIAHTMSEMGQHVLVTFVIAIARGKQRVNPRPYKGMRNTLQVSVGDCRVIIAAYRSLESGRLTANNIRLRLAGPAG